MSAVCSVDGRIITDYAGVLVRWDEYFEHLYQVDPQEVSLDARDVAIPVPDPPISNDPPNRKIFAHILLRRILNHLVRQEQSGFTPGKSTIDRILALRVFAERRRREFGRLKTFDSVHRESLWEILTWNFYTDYWFNSKSIYCQCGATLGNIKVMDLDFADDIVVLSDPLESLIAALDAFSNEVKIQDFGGLLREPVQTIYACSEDIEVTESFTCLGSAVHVSGLSD
ncbi:uncharacterized protein [Penaeus vannamei]|uniref:uncharacterized protein n=1 Tax=Penaeus vannamei TaxID=6689 RepID=UPI00387F8622